MVLFKTFQEQKIDFQVVYHFHSVRRENNLKLINTYFNKTYHLHSLFSMVEMAY